MMAFCSHRFLNFDFFLPNRVQKAKMHQHSILYWNQSNGFWDITIFSIFKMAAGCRHGFLKPENVISWRGPEGRDASPCQITSKSVNALWRYSFLIFQDGSHPPSWICLGHIWTVTTHEWHLVKNLNAIDAVVKKIWKFEFFARSINFKMPIYTPEFWVVGEFDPHPLCECALT